MTWDRLRAQGVRSVIGLEMEAATIGEVARTAGVPEWIVVKGVMDHADPNKNDRFKPFAARVSAEVLARFLEERFASQSPAGPPSASIAQGLTTNSWRPRSPADTVFDEVRVAISQNTPRFCGLFDVARSAALDAHKDAERAHEIANQIRRQLATDLETARNKAFNRSKVRVLVSPGINGEKLIAKLWDSGDEYLGEGDAAGATVGLGVLKVHARGKDETPNFISGYAGRMEGRYGPSGVFTFQSQAQFAGQWTDGHSSLGYREQLGPGYDLECDFYLGAMAQYIGREGKFLPYWEYEGDGVAVDVNQRRVICGRFHAGKLIGHADNSAFPF